MIQNQKPFLFNLLVACLIACVGFVVLSGCEDQGPLEKAGEKIDESVDDVGDHVEDLGEEVEEGLEPQ